MAQMVILLVIGAVVLRAIGLIARDVRRELQRRHHVDRVRARLGARPTVAELRDRCGADSLPYYPQTPAAAGLDPDSPAVAGSIQEVSR